MSSYEKDGINDAELNERWKKKVANAERKVAVNAWYIQ
jgi:hypothetical protein